MSTSDKDARLICLAPGDNVRVLATSVTRGTTLTLDTGTTITLERNLSLGHKIASRDIAPGETIVKYAFPIGIATDAIPCGGHVHVHNVRSDYTPTYVVPDP